VHEVALTSNSFGKRTVFTLNCCVLRAYIGGQGGGDTGSYNGEKPTVEHTHDLLTWGAYFLRDVIFVHGLHGHRQTDMDFLKRIFSSGFDARIASLHPMTNKLLDYHRIDLVSDLTSIWSHSLQAILNETPQLIVLLFSGPIDRSQAHHFSWPMV